MYGTHTLAFQRIFVRMKIIALIFIRFSYVSLIRNSVTGPLIRMSKLESTLNHCLFLTMGKTEKDIENRVTVVQTLELTVLVYLLGFV
jgi:hypothetical protein